MIVHKPTHANANNNSTEPDDVFEVRAEESDSIGSDEYAGCSASDERDRLGKDSGVDSNERIGETGDEEEDPTCPQSAIGDG